MRIHCFGNSHLWTVFGRQGVNNSRMTLSDGNLELVGWKLGESGATAYGLMKVGSVTGAGEAIPRLLDGEAGRKTVMLTFGETDVSSHIGHHGGEWEDELDAAIERYGIYARLLLERPDVDRILITSMVPRRVDYQGEFERLREITLLWNVRLRRMCEAEGLTYVDWHDCVDALDGAMDGTVDDERMLVSGDVNEPHLSPSLQSLLISQVRTALHLPAPTLPAEPPKEMPEEGRMVFISPRIRRVLRKVLERDTTAAIVHGGLAGILGLPSDDACVLVNFLRSVL